MASPLVLGHSRPKNWIADDPHSAPLSGTTGLDRRAIQYLDPEPGIERPFTFTGAGVMLRKSRDCRYNYDSVDALVDSGEASRSAAFARQHHPSGRAGRY